ncbi:MAG: NADH-quinone oxidoreductase subunit C [Thermodesulfobacteriota bacterium]
MSVAEDSILVKKIRKVFGSGILETATFRGEVTHLIKKEALLDICAFLRSEADIKMNFLADIVGVDRHPEKPRFEVVYHLCSFETKQRIRLKLRVEEGEAAPSLTGLWRSAACAEREAYDMFGIVFDGHENLRRIYLSEDWEGFPLRKDYPLKGYKDRYNPYGEDKD